MTNKLIYIASPYAGEIEKNISFAKPEGRRGKTTTCANLGIGLAQEGKEVLLVDCDPQGGASRSAWASPSRMSCR